MKVFIAGGRGRVGSRLGGLLAGRGDVVVPGEPADGVDVLTGEGLDDALAGVEVIVNVLNTDRFDAEGARAFFTTSTRRLDEAGARAGVRRHVLLSIVGVGSGTASSNGYYVGKVAQEQALRAGVLPWSVVRATQFQSYVPVLADQHTVDGVVRAPRSLVQPVDLDEVVALLAEVATAPEPVDVVEIAGPDRYPLDDLLRASLAASGDERPVVTVADEGDPEALVPHGPHRVGAVRLRLDGAPAPRGTGRPDDGEE